MQKSKKYSHKNAYNKCNYVDQTERFWRIFMQLFSIHWLSVCQSPKNIKIAPENILKIPKQCFTILKYSILEFNMIWSSQFNLTLMLYFKLFDLIFFDLFFFFLHWTKTYWLYSQLPKTYIIFVLFFTFVSTWFRWLTYTNCS